MQKEAKARLKINELLAQSGWRLLDSEKGPATVRVETHTKIEEVGDDYERVSSGFIDYLLTDERGFPVAVLEAKSEDKDPMAGKEQARDYAKSQNCRYIILSNGNQHWFWDREVGNPMPISHFPSLEALQSNADYKPDANRLISEPVEADYVARTQNPQYHTDPRWQDPDQRATFLEETELRMLRKYQLEAVQSLKDAVSDGKKAFLFEMATGTGKTLTAAAIIKLFLRTKNARRVLFLVDRLELENQAWKDFVKYLKNDYTTRIFKENRDDWQKAEIVVTTIQSISYNNKYLSLFTPTDFDLVISDEAHRSISGGGRVLFNYFLGYKLGLTATPRDYLKNIDEQKVSEMDPREVERRVLLSTYKAFGCESGTPTFRYSLLDGVKEGYLVSPVALDCRTEITTKLLSEDGYTVQDLGDDGEEVELVFKQKDYERRFFSEETNRQFVQTFFEHAAKDPITGEVGKTIMFAVSRKHASRLTQLLNEYAHALYPGKYQSDFALQITSDIPGAQSYTINFANNNLSGHTEFLDGYKSSKTRVCVTVGMMTTGYDCKDILNVCLVRPIFSPTDFIQIKGRGTRTYNFRSPDGSQVKPKENFKLFDFFANCEYFEEKYPYDEVIKLPPAKKATEMMVREAEAAYGEAKLSDDFVSERGDQMLDIATYQYGSEGMRIDREMYQRFESQVKESYAAHPEFKQAVDSGDYERMEQFVKENLFNKPTDYIDMDKLRQSYHADRRLSLWEILDKVFGRIPHFKSKNDLAKEEFDRYIVADQVSPVTFYEVKEFFKMYLADEEARAHINKDDYNYFAAAPEEMAIMQTLGKERIDRIKSYVHDNVNLNQFN